MRITIENKMTRTLWPSKFLKMKEIMEMEKEEHREKEIFASGFWNSFEKKFRTWPKSVNFAKFRPKFIFRLFLKILLNIFKLLFPKSLNFGGAEISEFREISAAKFWTLFRIIRVLAWWVHDSFSYPNLATWGVHAPLQQNGLSRNSNKVQVT